jgi:hypothetical protein
MWSLIPQVFYDFLARVVPGASLLAFAILVIFGPNNVSSFINSPGSEKLFSAGFILVWVLASYLTGFLLGQLWELTFGQLTKQRMKDTEAKYQEQCLSEHNRVQKVLKHSELVIAPNDLPRTYNMRDQIRHIAPEEASRLLKVRGERRMCQVLFLGFFILIIVNGGYLIAQFETARIVLEVILIAASIVCWNGAQRLSILLVNGTTASWLTFVSSGRLPLRK